MGAGLGATVRQQWTDRPSPGGGGAGTEGSKRSQLLRRMPPVLQNEGHRPWWSDHPGLLRQGWTAEEKARGGLSGSHMPCKTPRARPVPATWLLWGLATSIICPSCCWGSDFSFSLLCQRPFHSAAPEGGKAPSVHWWCQVRACTPEDAQALGGPPCTPTAQGCTPSAGPPH